MKQTVNVGLIGLGTVGTGVAKILYGSERPFLRGRPFDIRLARIADLDITTDRGVDIPDGVLTTDAESVLNDPGIGVVVELIGGYEPAKTFTLAAFANGKSVITANKALIARHGAELLQAAKENGVSYMFEASVAGGIPIIRGLMNGLNANVITSVYGILNGTTNYILTAMARDGADYGEVLHQAQELGYAEADPTSDVSGGDALNKLVIIARLAFGANLDVDEVYCEGIENITLQDLQYADELGCAIKLLAISKIHEDGRVEARVHPTLVPASSVLASVEDEFNAVEVYGDAVGRELFYGKGAGMMPTASAVVSDVVDTAARIHTGGPSNIDRLLVDGNGPEMMPMEELRLRYYLRFTVRDSAGVLAAISRIFSEEDISLEAVIQKGTARGEHVPLVIMTHMASEGAMQRAMARFDKLDVVHGRVQLIRCEDV